MEYDPLVGQKKMLDHEERGPVRPTGKPFLHRLGHVQAAVAILTGKEDPPIALILPRGEQTGRGRSREGRLGRAEHDLKNPIGMIAVISVGQKGEKVIGEAKGAG
jgi:hypothetical protein